MYYHTRKVQAHYNGDNKAKLVSYRSRCKFCFEVPGYYGTLSGLTYYIPSLSVRGKKINLKLERKAVVDSASVKEYSVWYMKKHKDQYAKYRFCVLCGCGQTQWLYTTSSQDNFDVATHRRLPYAFDAEYVYVYLRRKNERIKYE